MATSLQDLITRTRRRANIENNYFVSDDELTDYLNSSLGEMYDVMTNTYNDYNITTFQSILTNLNNIIPIPSSFDKIRGVDFQLQDAPSNWTTLYAFGMPQRNRRNNSISNFCIPFTNVNLVYRLINVGIMIEPAQQCQGTYQVWYVPKYVPLVALTDTLTIQMDTNAWSEYAIVDCCIKILNKQNLDPSGFMANKDALAIRIKSSAQNRDAASPRACANVRFGGDFGNGMGSGSGGWGY